MFRFKLMIVGWGLGVLLLAGCSDLGKGKVPKKVIESNRFNAGCKLEINEFKFILKRDISAQINCLQKSIDLFIKVVESGKPGYLSRTAFVQYVIKNMPDFGNENVEAIQSVFEIAHLVFGDDREYLSPSSVRKIFDFIYVFNREVPTIYPFFESKEEGTPFPTHNINRNRVYRVLDNISRALLDIFKRDRGDQLHKVNIIKILESFTNSNAEDVLERVKAVLFIKRIILGGEQEELTHLELGKLLEKLAPAGSVVFDLLRVQYLDLTQKSLMELIQRDLEVLDTLLYYAVSSNERLFSIDDLIEAIPYFLDNENDWPDFKQYRREVLQAKMLLMSNAPWSKTEDLTGKEWVIPGDLRIFLDHAKEIAKRGSIYHKIYEFFQTVLNSPGPVTINYNQYLLQFPSHGKYVQEFSRIATQYRFFYGEFEMPYYSLNFRRNSEGMVEQGVFEYILGILGRRFGSEADVVGGWRLDQAQLFKVFKVFGRFLSDEGFITPKREVKLTQNITLLATLFQSMSNGDSVISVDEGAAFASQVIPAFKYAEWFESQMGKRCPTDNRGRVTDLNCHRENYFNLLCERFQPHYPQLFLSLGMKDCRDKGNLEFQKDYLKTMEYVARTCTVFKDGTDVPISKDDYMPLMVMLQTVEGTMLRFDVNKNNKLDPSEVRTAYDTIFKTAIEALVAEQASIIAKLPFNLGSTISKRVYYYLIKYKAIPKKVSDYFKLLTIGATSAHRDTFAAALKIISMESENTPIPGEPGPPAPFDCETLR